MAFIRVVIVAMVVRMIRALGRMRSDHRLRQDE